MSTTLNNSGIPILGKLVNLKTYLPAGLTLIAHWLPWFGQASHKDIPGYDSRDPQVCAAQCALMQSMGIDGINVDWYGPGHTFENEATLHMLTACENSGLKFSICIDHGGINNAAADYPAYLQYIAETFTPSNNYLKDPASGKPIVTFFGEPAVDLSSIKANFFFLFQDGWSHASGDGAFGWVDPLSNSQDINTTYLLSFVQQSAANQNKMAWFPIYPGFDDALASWGTGRMMDRRNGLTMLDTMSHVPAAGKWALIATWNDHEEGSAIELSQG